MNMALRLPEKKRFFKKGEAGKMGDPAGNSMKNVCITEITLQKQYIRLSLKKAEKTGKTFS